MAYSEVRDACIVGAVRTPVGRLGGQLAAVRPDDLGAIVLSELVSRTGVPASDVEDVCFGCANQAGEDNRDVARMSLLLAGYPVHVGGVTVNRLCGSGLEAVAQATRSVMLGEADVYVAGGVESMSRAPFAFAKAQHAYQTGSQTAHDTTLGWRFVNPEMEAREHTDPLGITAENLADERNITRERQDRFALHSHRKAVRAMEAGRFRDECVNVVVSGRKGDTIVDADEGPRADATLDSLAGLKPAFQAGGTVTAGNSSPLNDGAAALLVVSSQYAQANGLTPLARIRSMAAAGVPPRIMGIGPVPAVAKALERVELEFDDIAVIELNEAFAAQSLAVLDEWDVDFEDERVNPNGGAIALGHPLGCSGARLMTTLVHELQRREGAALGLATMCIGVGQGIALIVEKEDG